MNPETRLAEIVAALEDAGFVCLVMGGHAVRYYYSGEEDPYKWCIRARRASE